MNPAMTPQELDARSLALHRLVAEKLRAEPARFDRARATLARFFVIVDPRSRTYMEAWRRIFDEGVEAAIAAATEDSERGAALRQASPFAGVLTPQERWQFLRTWRTSRDAAQRP